MKKILLVLPGFLIHNSVFADKIIPETIDTPTDFVLPIRPPRIYKDELGSYAGGSQKINNLLEAQDIINIIHDQVILAEIAKKNTINYMRIAAIYKLEDQELITEIAMNEKDDSVREAALKKLFLDTNTNVEPPALLKLRIKYMGPPPSDFAKDDPILQMFSPKALDLIKEFKLRHDPLSHSSRGFYAVGEEGVEKKGEEGVVSSHSTFKIIRYYGTVIPNLIMKYSAKFYGYVYIFDNS